MSRGSNDELSYPSFTLALKMPKWGKGGGVDLKNWSATRSFNLCVGKGKILGCEMRGFQNVRTFWKPLISQPRIFPFPTHKLNDRVALQFFRSTPPPFPHFGIFNANVKEGYESSSFDPRLTSSYVSPNAY